MTHLTDYVRQVSDAMLDVLAPLQGRWVVVRGPGGTRVDFIVKVNVEEGYVVRAKLGTKKEHAQRLDRDDIVWSYAGFGVAALERSPV